MRCLCSILKNYLCVSTQNVTESLQKGTLEIIFPRSGVLVLKRSSFYADFALRGFSLPPKIRGERGPPV